MWALQAERLWCNFIFFLTPETADLHPVRSGTSDGGSAPCWEIWPVTFVCFSKKKKSSLSMLTTPPCVITYIVSTCFCGHEFRIKYSGALSWKEIIISLSIKNKFEKLKLHKFLLQIYILGRIKQQPVAMWQQKSGLLQFTFFFCPLGGRPLKSPQMKKKCFSAILWAHNGTGAISVCAAFTGMKRFVCVGDAGSMSPSLFSVSH